MNLRTFSILLAGAPLFLFGCQVDDISPVVPTPLGLDGTWKTDGVNVHVNPNEGTRMSITLHNGTFRSASTEYFRVGTGAWQASDSSADSGTYSLDNSFLVLGTEDGRTMHYTIASDGNTLILNTTVDHGGIYVGGSASLVGQPWSYTVGGRKRSYLFQSSTNGLYLNDYLDGSTVDTVYFSYGTSANVLTVNWLYILVQGQQFTYDSNPYVSVFQLANNKLYIYGKPYTRDNDDYLQYELYRQ